jgi:hypothetical protein
MLAQLYINQKKQVINSYQSKSRLKQPNLESLTQTMGTKSKEHFTTPKALSTENGPKPRFGSLPGPRPKAMGLLGELCRY